MQQLPSCQGVMHRSASAQLWPTSQATSACWPGDTRRITPTVKCFKAFGDLSNVSWLQHCNSLVCHKPTALSAIALLITVPSISASIWSVNQVKPWLRPANNTQSVFLDWTRRVSLEVCLDSTRLPATRTHAMLLPQSTRYIRASVYEGLSSFDGSTPRSSMSPPTILSLSWYMSL